MSLLVVTVSISAPLLGGWCGGEWLLARRAARRLMRETEARLVIANEGRP